MAGQTELKFISFHKYLYMYVYRFLDMEAKALDTEVKVLELEVWLFPIVIHEEFTGSMASSSLLQGLACKPFC